LTRPSAALPPEIKELRRRPRFELTAELSARFTGIPVRLIDVSAGGLQMEHADPVRLGSSGTLVIDGEDLIEVRSRVVWSRLLPRPGQPNLYRSGLSFTEIDEVAGKLGRFIRAYGRPEHGSLERKRERLTARHEKKPTMVFINVPQTLATDDTLMIQQARQRLSSSPDEALKWYNRAKFALTERLDLAAEVAHIQHRQEVLAVWEYLERRVPIAAIIKAFHG
jgi:hypothetical protein